MKKFLLFIIFAGALVYLYASGFLGALLQQVQARTGNIFIPSITKEVTYTSANYPWKNLPLAEKILNEYSESTIKKDGFYLRIDKISLFKQIIKDVDPRDKETYTDSWKYGVSHGMFTATPDQVGITYLFSHAVSDKTWAMDNNAWFSYMDQLIVGDDVIVYYQSKKYTYKVNEILVVSPGATGYYTGTSPVSKVRMQFCGPPTGSINSRTLVDAVLVNTEAV
jgi:sortase (surface protein transpeptidase)